MGFDTFAASLPGMWERTITVGSAGKTFTVTGWKIGWAYGPAHLIKNLQVVHMSCVYACSTPLQEALANAFETEIKRLGTSISFLETFSDQLEPKRRLLCQVLEEIGMKPIFPQGGCFVVADWSPLGLWTPLQQCYRGL